MTYSQEALCFAKVPVAQQIRLEDRISYLYLEYCKVIQNRTGVAAISEDEGQKIQRVLQIPVAGMAVLFLGPGTSVSQAALASCSRSGLTVIFSGAGGAPFYTHATPLTSSARWAIAQARVTADEKKARSAAKLLYRRQLCLDIQKDLSISQMRGLEGSIMKKRYRELSRKYQISGFKRDTSATDPVNSSLNMVNGILYGCAASACAALGVNPALGIIHRGDIRALLFDLADLHKSMASLPIAFRSATASDPAEFARRETRKYLMRRHVLEGFIETLMEIYTPHLPRINDDRLVGDQDDAEVAGHTNYSS